MLNEPIFKTLACLAVFILALGAAEEQEPQASTDLWDRYCLVEDPLARYPIPEPGDPLIGSQSAFYTTPYDIAPGNVNIPFLDGLDAADGVSFTATNDNIPGTFTYRFTVTDPDLIQESDGEVPDVKALKPDTLWFRQLPEVLDRRVLVQMQVDRVFPDAAGWEGRMDFRDGELPIRVDVLEAELHNRMPEVRCRQYGPHVRQSFDIYYPEGFRPGIDPPLPVRLFIHGGGWGAGDKMIKGVCQKGGDADKHNAEGMAFVSVGYRLVSQYQDHPAMRIPVAASLLDAARCLQYIRYHAEELGLDPERVAAGGGSAGGATTCWLAMHDDLANPDSPDSIARMSTRLTCAVPSQAQTSIDPKQMREWIPSITYGAHAFHPDAPRGEEGFEYGLQHRDSVLQAIEDFSAYGHASADDPPMFHDYIGQPNLIPAVDGSNATHHPQFGVKLHERLQELGVESWIEAGHPEYQDSYLTTEGMPPNKMAFIKEHFGMNEE